MKKTQIFFIAAIFAFLAISAISAATVTAKNKDAELKKKIGQMLIIGFGAPRSTRIHTSRKP
jgi:hypothetical protein